MTTWLRAIASGGYVMVGDRPLHPGGAVAYDDSPAHWAIVQEIASGAGGPLELVESETDPSLPPPPEPPDPAAERARAATRDLERRLRRDNPSEPPHHENSNDDTT